MAFILARIITIVLLIFATKELPYDYYTILRFIVCGTSLYGANYAYKNNMQLWIWIFGLTAVLFNPFAPIYLSKTTWIYIDIIIALIYTVSLYSLRYSKIYQKG